MKKVWVLLVLVLVMMFVLSRQKETFEQKRCLLLVCCIHVRDEKEKRIGWYTDAINKYLENTNLQIRVIESSGYRFPIEHERFKQHSFNTKIEPGNTTPTSLVQTQREAESIIEANKSGILDGFDLVIKITGKYYVPEIETEILNIPDDCGIVYQHTTITPESSGIPSEIFGFRKEYTDEIFDLMINEKNPDMFFEKIILNIHQKLNCKSYIFPRKMKVECINECAHSTDKRVLTEI